MAASHIATLATKSVSAAYNTWKDLFLYIMGQRQDTEELEYRIKDLNIDVICILSWKDEIDKSLENSIIIEKSTEYVIVEKNIRRILKKYTRFICKYTGITSSNIPSPTGDQDISSLASMIYKFKKINLKLFKVNFLKLAMLNRDIAKLSRQTSDVAGRLKPKLHGNDLPVFNKYVDEVLQYLSGKGNRVGILGPSGVGKTTVLRKLYTQLSGRNNSSHWDYIIFTEYPSELMTKEEIFKKLQNEMMVQLKINYKSKNNAYQNAVIISKFLCEKNYVLLMDQVSNSIDLNKLGLSEHHKYGNIVIASDNRKAISSMIEYEVEIQRLSKYDAWNVFENIYGKIPDGHLRAIAGAIIETCGGITREIKLIATFLKNNKERSLWNDVKRITQSDAKFHKLIGLGGIDKIYNMMYEKLDMHAKKCLLYVALFPSEYKIHRDYLIECWIAEGFMIEDGLQKLNVNREYGQTILDQLTDLYLLEWCSDKNYVKMQPNVRRVALEKEYPDEEKSKIWVPLNDEEPNEETWMEVTRMSLIGCRTMLPKISKMQQHLHVAIAVQARVEKT